MPPWKAECAKSDQQASIVPLSSHAVALLKGIHQFTRKGTIRLPSERSPLRRPMSDGTLTAALRTLGYSRAQMTARQFRYMASMLLHESVNWRAELVRHPVSIRVAHLRAIHCGNCYSVISVGRTPRLPLGLVVANPRERAQTRVAHLTPPLEELHRALVLLGRRAAIEGTEIAPFVRARVELA